MCNLSSERHTGSRTPRWRWPGGSFPTSRQRYRDAGGGTVCCQPMPTATIARRGMRARGALVPNQGPSHTAMRVSCWGPHRHLRAHRVRAGADATRAPGRTAEGLKASTLPRTRSRLSSGSFPECQWLSARALVCLNRCLSSESNRQQGPGSGRRQLIRLGAVASPTQRLQVLFGRHAAPRNRDDVIHFKQQKRLFCQRN